jgi:hypothetical protein
MRLAPSGAGMLIFGSIKGEDGMFSLDDQLVLSAFCYEFASSRISGFDIEAPIICRDSECVGIRWADKSRSVAVADPVPDDAREWYPVSCSEAKYEMSNAGHASKSDLERKQGRKRKETDFHEAQTVYGPLDVGDLASWAPKRRRPLRMGRVQTYAPKVTMKDVGTQTDTESTPSATRSKANHPYVNLHYHRILEDNRPRVHVQFVKQADRNPEPFSLLLDTGSHVSYIRMRSLICPPRAGYQDGGLAQPVRTTLRFGEVDRSSVVRITRRVDEAALIGSGFSFALDLNVATTCEDEYVGTGLLGASRSSHLAKTAAVFAYKPTGTKYEFIHNKRSAGTLLIGKRNWNEYCQSPPVNVRNKYETSHIHWVVSGSVTFASTFMQHTSPSVDWVVDTGAGRILLTSSLYMQLVAFIESAGGQIPDRSPSKLNVIYNCMQSMAAFPILRISVGTGPTNFEMDIPPTEYLGYFDQRGGYCFLNMEYSELSGLPNTGIIGMMFLEKVFTVFDRKNNQVGFCKPRH